MLAATQLGLVPPEVKSQQDDLFTITKQVRESWPAAHREYKSEDVRRIATALNRSISGLIDAMVNAAEDSIVDENAALVKQFDQDVREMQKFQLALVPFVEQSRSAGTVDIPEFRTAIPTMMERVANFWRAANPTHDLFLSWINGSQAEGIAQGYRDILEVVFSLPGAKAAPGFLARHGKKIAIGVVAVGAGGAATLWFLRRQRSGALQDSELLPAAELQVPVGVHIFRSGEDDAQRLLSPAAFEEREPSPISDVAAMLRNVIR